MSGIAGIIHFDGKPIEQGLIEMMTGAMAHRGPDGINHWVNGSVAFGQCMLRTTPESLEEHQPLTNEDESLVLVMDGRVDNWEELRMELLGKGAVLRDRSDAELVIRAYEIWGGDCLKHIDGDFALVLADVRRQEAFCARDRMANKTLNYYWNDNTFAFASELHALFKLPWVPEIFNEGMLAEFLANEFYSKEQTFWKGIFRLAGSYQIRVSPKGLNLNQYWKPDFTQALSIESDSEYIERYHEIFSDMVKRLSRSHLPVAFEVSGGLDSSAVFCMAEKLRRSRKLFAPAVLGFTLAFPNDKDADELEYSRAVGEHLGLEILEIPPTIAPLSWYREWASFYREFPGFPNGAMSLGLRQTAIDSGCRVLLGGTGGDEWLGTIRGIYYTEELASRRWQKLWQCFLADCRETDFSTSLSWFLRFGMIPFLPSKIQDLLRMLKRRISVGYTNARVSNASWLTSELKGTLDNRRKDTSNNVPQVKKRMGQYRQYQILEDAFLPFAGELEERMASRMGLELRCPMRTSQLVEFAIATPERLRLRGRTNKFIHVQAMQDILPLKVLERKTKADFSILFRKHIEDIEQELTQEIPKKRGTWVEVDRIRSVFEDYREQIGSDQSSSGGAAQWILWNLLICDLFVDEISKSFS